MMAVRMMLGAVVAFATVAVMADEKPKFTPLMTEAGKELFKDDLSTPFSGKWKAAKGKWEVVDGSIRGKELKEDMHGAVARVPVKFTNAVIQFDFKLDGAKNCSFSVNDASGHVCRVTFNSTGFAVQKDKHDKKDANDKAVVMERKAIAIKPGEWHSMVIEICGKEMIATLDGKTTAIGEHAFIDREKANIGLTIAGESCSYRHLRIHEATRRSDWEKTRTQLKSGTN